MSLSKIFVPERVNDRFYKIKVKLKRLSVEGIEKLTAKPGKHVSERLKTNPIKKPNKENSFDSAGPSALTNAVSVQYCNYF